MTASLERAFAKSSNLPKAAQNQLAKQMIDDIEAELKWDQTLANSQELLEKMARNARQARRAGNVICKGFDEL